MKNRQKNILNKMIYKYDPTSPSSLNNKINKKHQTNKTSQSNRDAKTVVPWYPG